MLEEYACRVDVRLLSGQEEIIDTIEDSQLRITKAIEASSTIEETKGDRQRGHHCR
jgi:hypothetical protein